MGGLVGALIWAAISYFLNFEIGYVAWGLGFLVGYLSTKFGGDGVGNGIMCATVALASIVLGKGLAVHFALNKELDGIKQSSYEEWKGDAVAFKEIKGEESEYSTFIVEHHFSDAETPDDVQEEELEYFKSDTIPQLDKLAAGQSISDWENSFEENAGIDTNAIVANGIKESIGVLDIVFGLLGIMTAFKVGGGASNEED